MARKKPAAKAAPTPADAGPPDEHFNEAETLPAAPSQPAPKKAARKAKGRPGLAETIGNPDDVDLGGENTLKIGTAPDARGKKQAVEAQKADEGDDEA